MAYQKYLGEGVILSMGEWGESGRTLKILTHDGVKSLVATGVRELGSKMRSEIDVLSKVEFEFVEGKEVGRLVGIFPKEKLLDLSGYIDTLVQNKYVLENILQIRNSISNVVNFVLRIVVGETENTKLYENFIEGLGAIQDVSYDGQDFQILEIIWLVKILVSLGYWEEGLHDRFDEESFKYVSEHRKEIIEQINKSIESSHM